MNLPTLSIIDHLFSHAYSSSNWFKPKHFNWKFNPVESELLEDSIFITDMDVMKVDSLNIPVNVKKYAWLVESPVITPNSYQYVYENATKFDKVFTHSKKILDSHSNAYLLPIGGCHIEEADIHLEHHKSKLVSMMYSYKNFVGGHGIRHEIASKYSTVIDVMGSGKTGAHVPKIESCRDYAFSVVVENCKEGYYFTEKIVDCFLTGTVPIYWGSDYIGDFFNKEGFLTFSTVEELYSVVRDRDYLVNFYTDHVNEIVENYEKALKYKVAEDFLYETYKTIL
jgi:hypothetical protein